MRGEGGPRPEVEITEEQRNVMQERVEERTHSLARFSFSPSPEEYEGFRQEASREILLEDNLDKANREFNQKYINGWKNSFEERLEDNPTASKVFGFVKNFAYGSVAGGAARSFVSGLLLHSSAYLGVGIAAAPAAAIGGMAVGGTVGGVMGYRRGKESYEKTNLTKERLESAIGASRTLGDTLTLSLNERIHEKALALVEGDTLEERENNLAALRGGNLGFVLREARRAVLDEDELETDELNKQVNELEDSPDRREELNQFYASAERALAHYNAIAQERGRSGGAIFDSRAEISRFYENRARLETILQTRHLREATTGPVTPETRAEAILRSLNQAERPDAERFAGGITESARVFLAERLSQRHRVGVTEAKRQALWGAIIGGGTAYFVGGLLKSNNVIGGGHYNPEMAQNYAVHNSQFVDLVKTIESGDFAQASQLAHNLNLEATSDVFDSLQDVIKTARDQGYSQEAVGRLSHNVLSFAHQRGVDADALLESVKQALNDPEQLRKINPSLSIDSFIDAVKFRQLDFDDVHIAPAFQAANHKIGLLSSLLGGQPASATAIYETAAVSLATTLARAAGNSKPVREAKELTSEKVTEAREKILSRFTQTREPPEEDPQQGRQAFESFIQNWITSGRESPFGLPEGLQNSPEAQRAAAFITGLTKQVWPNAPSRLLTQDEMTLALQAFDANQDHAARVTAVNTLTGIINRAREAVDPQQTTGRQPRGQRGGREQPTDQPQAEKRRESRPEEAQEPDLTNELQPILEDAAEYFASEASPVPDTPRSRLIIGTLVRVGLVYGDITDILRNVPDNDPIIRSAAIALSQTQPDQRRRRELNKVQAWTQNRFDERYGDQD